jgi:alpha-beta hydrolase superfamily lysophospholipase
MPTAPIPSPRSTPASPVVFVHGLWLHASSWFPWIEAFAEAGYTATAPTWPNEPDTVEAAREQADSQAGTGIDDVVEHFTKLIADLPEPPVLVGHSFGGTIVERLLGEGVGRAGIAIDAAPIKGVLPLPISSLRSAFPVLKNPANRNKAISLTAEQFRYGFGNAIPGDESDDLYHQWNIPAPGRPLFQAATANFTPHSQAAVDTDNETRGPLLLIAGGEDHTVPEAVTKSTFKQYRHSDATTELLEFPDRGHSLVIDNGWREIADACLSWLNKQGL